jgi:ubiquitin fusion degradation protein 1
MDQGAHRQGPMYFSLTTPGGAVAHAGLLDCTAPEGTVLLPPGVAERLWGRGAEAHGSLTVAYTRLQRGLFARFSPATRAFHEQAAATGVDLRSVLEAALTARSTLTVGEWVEVELGDGAPHALRVAELRPEPQVSLIDTDMEADVGPSLEAEAHVREREEAEARAAEAAAEAAAEQTRIAEAALAAARAVEAGAAEAAGELAALHARQRAEASARLPPEPGPGGDTVAVLFRMPDGGRHQRRFRVSDPLALLFTAADAAGAGGLEPGSYRLVRQFPRAAFAPSDAAGGATLEAAGFSGGGGGGDALLLEPL